MTGRRTGGEPGDGSGLPARRSLRPLAGVLAATAVSVTGTRVSAIALPWFVLVTTGSATRTGVVAFCEMAPYVLAKMFSGPLLDRAGPRRISWAADAVSAAAAGLVPLLHTLGLLSFGPLLGLVAVVGAARGPGDLAKKVMVPEAAERARVPLERATGLTGTTDRLAGTAGPAAGGWLIALLGPMAGLAVNAACFAAGSLVVALTLPRGMGLPAEPSNPAAGSAGPVGAPRGSGYWRRFGEGFAFLRREPLLLTVITVVGLTNLLDTAFITVLVPVWARESGAGPAVIGLTAAAGGAAAVIGSLIAAAVAHQMPRRPVFFAGYLLCGAPRWLVLAADAPLPAVLAVFALGGFGAGFLNPILGAVTFERVPRRLLGRVGALGDSLAWAGIPLGGLLAGAAVGAWGLVPVLVAGGAAYFLATQPAGLRREWRVMDQRRGGRGRAVPAAPDGPVRRGAATGSGGPGKGAGGQGNGGAVLPVDPL